LINKAEENLPEILNFKLQLQRHATMEEEIFFPAAILIADHLKLKTS
jgi:hypothetical protein